ncbi:UNVERIFIED_CONTAM: hypothetical protein FKN15_068401 [Acipenser sinensis]
MKFDTDVEDYVMLCRGEYGGLWSHGVAAILDLMKSLDNIQKSSSHERCSQAGEETVSAYTLLWELFHRIERRNSTEPGMQDVVLRDQWVFGLQPGAVCQDLQHQVHWTPTLTFPEVYRKARVLDEGAVSQLKEIACCAIIQRFQPSPDLDGWKKEVRVELLSRPSGHLQWIGIGPH